MYFNHGIIQNIYKERGGCVISELASMQSTNEALKFLKEHLIVWYKVFFN
jgi:hypothetical protein